MKIDVLTLFPEMFTGVISSSIIKRAIDDKKIEYVERNIRISDKLCPDVDGRYSIEVNFIPDRKFHVISCKIKDYISSKEDGIESGERLELKSFYRNNTKLSIGMEGAAGCKDMAAVLG